MSFCTIRSGLLKSSNTILYLLRKELTNFETGSIFKLLLKKEVVQKQ